MATTIDPVTSPTAARAAAPAPGKNPGDLPSFEQILQASTVVPGQTIPGQEAVGTLGADNDATEDRFLALLVAQMRNQDPLNPLENAEVTTQLAQINTVRGIEDLGKTMSELLARFDQSSPVASADLIDRRVMVPSSSVFVTDDDMGAITAAAELTAPADALVADVYDGTGQVIRSLDLGSHGPGLVSFEWDGRDVQGDWAAAGRYGLRVRALNADGESSPPTSVAQRVVGIERGSDGLKLRLEGGASVPESSIRAVF